MKNFVLVIAIFLLLDTTCLADQAAKDEGIGIINKVVGVCQNEGMLACEKHFKGADILFDYIRTVKDLKEYDQAYVNFLKENYPGDNEFDIYVVRVSLNLDIDISFAPEQFTSNLADAHKTSEGFIFTMKSGDTFKMLQNDNTWLLELPPSQAAQLEPFQEYYLAGELKKLIYLYRTMEAQMVGLSKKQLQDNVSNDLAPLMVALFGKEKFPELMKYIIKKPGDVMDFYNQFGSEKDMENHIKKAHGLS